MSLSLRNTLFWLSDRLKGGPVRKHYKAIQKINADHDSDYAVRERRGYLTKILQHALETVPYYRKLGISETVLEQFPVVDKNRIKSDSSLFRSDAYLNKKTYKSTTSGSTGTPFTVLHDTEKKRRHRADVRYYWEAVGHSWGTRFYYLKIWNQQNRKSKKVQKMQNIVPVDVFKMNDATLQQLLEDIKVDTAPKSILGYASALDRIVKYLAKNPNDMSNASVVSVIAMSEALDGPTKKALQECFGCPVVSRYANLENGMLAQQTSDSGNDFLTNMASYHIEILGMQDDSPVEEGEIGRIVVTDLLRYR
jgi:phenylacetate-CoA ligase